MKILGAILKILLVYPVCPKNNFWSSAGSMSFVPGKKASMAPLGLPTVAAMLPADWDLKFVDMNIESLEDSDIAWADLVFVSAMIEQKSGALEVIGRSKLQEKKVVAGGPLFFSADLNDFPGVDHFFIGEAELTMPLFLKDLRKGELKKVYQSAELPDMSLSPMPRLDLVKMKKYTIMPVQNSRGCPHQCDFCSVSAIFGTKMRMQKVLRFIARIQAYYEAGWRGTIMIVDDNAIGSPYEAEQMFDALYGWQKAHNFPFDFIAQTSTKLADFDRLRHKMVLARVKKVFIGIETISDESLTLCNKKQNVGRNLTEEVRKILRSGIQVMAGFIVGLDGDKLSIFQELYDFIQTAGIAVAMINPLLVLPGTPLEKRMRSEGRLIEDPEKDRSSLGLNYKPLMGARALMDGFTWLQENLYRKKHYYWRVGQMIRYLKPTRGRKLSQLELKAFFLSLWKIVVLKLDWRYLRLLIQTFVGKSKAMPDVVSAAIMHVHYHGVVFHRR
jgi:radical SAM superfamily enzyme YgiQ (UPF0313 family)